MNAVSPVRAGSPSGLARLIAATSIGNALEWFDILVYGYFAAYIAGAFFPTGDPATSLLLTLGTFSVSFLARPVGALVLGAYADRVGRKASMLVSLVLMTGATLAIAVVPTYASIGVLAPAVVLVARLVQGFSAGGEFGSSTAFLVEHAPHRRGFVGSWQLASQGFSTLLASLFGAALTAGMDPASLHDWGWRVPFAFGVLVGPVGFYIRRHLDEPAHVARAAGVVSPTREVLARQKGRVLLAIGCLAVSTAVNYMLLYMPTYAVKTLHMPPTTGFVATLGAGVILTVLTPFSGMLSDRFGRTGLMLGSGGLILLALYPSFVLLNAHPTAPVIIAVVLGLATLKSIYFGPLPALMAELFPTETRATGLALSYNLGVTLFGGLGPVVMAWLGGVVGDLAPAFWLSAIACLSLVALTLVRSRTTLR